MKNEKIKTEFLVTVPFKVPHDNKFIGKDEVMLFWEQHKSLVALKQLKGCYVFATKPKGFTPHYVGMTRRTFGEEIFTTDKLQKYNAALHKTTKGNPVMFFIYHPRKGAKLHISELENFLIQIAYTKNRFIENSKGTRQPEWGIKNIIRSNGKSSNHEILFRKMMGITTISLLFLLFSLSSCNNQNSTTNTNNNEDTAVNNQANRLMTQYKYFTGMYTGNVQSDDQFAPYFGMCTFNIVPCTIAQFKEQVIKAQSGQTKMIIATAEFKQYVQMMDGENKNTDESGAIVVTNTWMTDKHKFTLSGEFITNTGHGDYPITIQDSGVWFNGNKWKAVLGKPQPDNNTDKKVTKKKNKR